MESIRKATGIIVTSHDFTTHSYLCTLFVIVLYYMLTNKNVFTKENEQPRLLDLHSCESVQLARCK